MLEIKFSGRGGQGVVMASQMLGLGFFKAGMYPQCYSLFGGERRGAPVVSFLRVDKEKILLKCDIKRPDELLCFDTSLIDIEEIRNLMRPGGRILISTDQPTLDIKLSHVINTTILGAYCRFTDHFSIDHLLAAIEEMVPAKKEANLEAARQGCAGLTILDEEN